MNLKEGTRRLALLLGVAGAIAGGVFSYAQLKSLMRQKADHRQFEQLANSDLVLDAKNWVTLTPEQRVKALAQMTPEHKSQLAKALGFNGTPKFDPNAPYAPVFGPPEDAPPTGFGPAEDDNGNPISGQTTSSDVGEIDKDGIKTIRWTSDHKVESLETQVGQTLYPTPAPNAGEYLLTAILPLLGFFIPWGTLRAIGWVGAGFKESSK